MRVVFLLLVAVNLIYLAWAGWIDEPAPAPPAPVSSDSLPALVLLSEDIARRSAGSPASAAAPVVPAVAQTASASEPDGRCVSVGPFGDLAQAASAAALLRERGFDPRQRAEAGETWQGYWVFVGGLKSSADETKVVRALERAGINDAQAMPQSDEEGRRVSVGLFTEKEGAERRAQAVKRLGYAAEIVERKQAGSVYWVDMDIGSTDRAVPTEGLLSFENAGARLEIRVCPAAAEPSQPSRPTPIPRDARPAATTADAGAPRPT